MHCPSFIQPWSTRFFISHVGIVNFTGSKEEISKKVTKKCVSSLSYRSKSNKEICVCVALLLSDSRRHKVEHVYTIIFSSPLFSIVSSAMDTTESSRKRQNSHVSSFPPCCYMFGLTHLKRKTLHLQNISKRNQRCLSPQPTNEITILDIHGFNTSRKFLRWKIWSMPGCQLGPGHPTKTICLRSYSPHMSSLSPFNMQSPTLRMWTFSLKARSRPSSAALRDTVCKRNGTFLWDFFLAWFVRRSLRYSWKLWFTNKYLNGFSWPLFGTWMEKCLRQTKEMRRSVHACSICMTDSMKVCIQLPIQRYNLLTMVFQHYSQPSHGSILEIRNQPPGKRDDSKSSIEHTPWNSPSESPRVSPRSICGWHSLQWAYQVAT